MENILFLFRIKTIKIFSFMPDIRLSKEQLDAKKYIEGAFGVISNMPLLCEHSASWEVLVSKRHIHDYNDDGDPTAQVPVNKQRNNLIFFYIFTK